MKCSAADFDTPPSLESLAGDLASRAARVDAERCFPDQDFAALSAGGLLAAPLPRRFGGHGYGTEPQGALGLLALLRAIGSGSIATGRLFEAHVNALKLISLYGTEAQIARAAADVHAGHVFGVWVTEAAPGVRLRHGRLEGAKSVCSGAGHVTRALVTADVDDAEPVMAIVSLAPGERVLPGAAHLSGVRGAVTAAMDLSGVPAEVIGAPGDYLRQPAFSAGAWRTSAVTLGGMNALSRCVRRSLAARGRDGNPNQQVRAGEIRIAETTAQLWLQHVGPMAEATDGTAGDIAGMVNLARIAVEAAALDIIRLAQRALGLPAFIVGGEAERLMRDLATYLRQPAPDETLTEAAAWFMERELPC